MKKIKVFLAGWVNFTNAQNLNCRSLAKHLDKERFEVATMWLYNGDLPIDSDLDGVKLLRCHWPSRYWIYITYLRGILWCDVAYLPKGEIWQFCARWLKRLGKKSFTTVEGVIDGTSLTKAIAFHGSRQAVVDSYSFTTKTFSITRYMVERNRALLGIHSDGVLYLGVEADRFQAQPRNHDSLTDIAFIGNNMRYKGVEDFFTLAARFPAITFHIVGGGIGYDAPARVAELQLTNVVCHGTLPHDRLAALLAKVDLHIFPSRSEGFPKVTLETAAMGVPSVVYADYGASEWITSGVNGFVVNSLDEIIAIVTDLSAHPDRLAPLSAAAIRMAHSFDWRSLIHSWQRAIESL